jgi:flagellar basal-body rod protein FlgB
MFTGQDIIKQALVKQLDASNLQQKVIANNIANINTPNFKKSKVSFEGELQKALSLQEGKLLTTHPKHIPTQKAINNIQPETVTIDNTYMRAGGNNVDLEEEMVNLSKSIMEFRAAAQMLSMRGAIKNYVVREGR